MLAGARLALMTNDEKAAVLLRQMAIEGFNRLERLLAEANTAETEVRVWSEEWIEIGEKRTEETGRHDGE